MTELERIAEQLHHAVTGGAWHGPAIREVLSGLTARQAAARPIRGGHSIWELVLHVTSWMKMFDAALHGTPLLPWPSAAMEKLDWPAVPRADAANWKKAQRELYAAARRLRRSIAGFAPRRMRERVPGRSFNFSHALPGILQHTVYHSGQMALIKKAL